MSTIVVLAQLDTIVDSASKLGQAGVVVILLFFVITLGFALRSLFNAHHQNTVSVITAITENTKVMEAHTRQLEANAVLAQANREAVTQMRLVIESIRDRERDRQRDRP